MYARTGSIGSTNRKTILAGLAAGISVATLVGISWTFSENRNASKVVTPAITSPFPFEADAPPERLVIPSLHIDAPVEEVGLAPDGSISVVPSYTAVGWYKSSPYPGAHGNAVIEGHFDTDDRSHPQAVFFFLNQLAPGDIVQIIDSHKRILRFRVAELRRYPYYAAPPELFASSTQNRLNLITCNGRWLRDIRVYDERLVVITERVP